MDRLDVLRGYEHSSIPMRRDLHFRDIKQLSPLVSGMPTEMANFFRFNPLTGRIYGLTANRLYRENSSIETATTDLIGLIKPHLKEGETVDEIKRKTIVLGELIYKCRTSSNGINFIGQGMMDILETLKYEGLLPENPGFVSSVINNGRYLESATSQGQALSFITQLIFSGSVREQYIGMMAVLYSERKIERGNLQKAKEYFSTYSFPDNNPTWDDLEKILSDLSSRGRIGSSLTVQAIRGGPYRAATALCQVELFGLEENPGLARIVQNLISDKKELERIGTSLTIGGIVDDYNPLYPEKTAEALLRKFQRCYRIIDRCLNLEVVRNYPLKEKDVFVQAQMF